VRSFWELPQLDARWVVFGGTASETAEFTGNSDVLLWENGEGHLARFQEAQAEHAYASGGWKQGWQAWDRLGVRVSQMGSLPVTLHLGFHFDVNTSVIVPKHDDELIAIWCYCRSPEFARDVRALDQSLKVTNATLVKVGFDLPRWREVAEREYPSGLPMPVSGSGGDVLFDGNPAVAESPLLIAIGRLVGYQWPRQTGSGFMRSPAVPADKIAALQDEDGIVCLPALRGEAAAVERVRALLADAFGAGWSPQKLNVLLANAGFAGKSLDEWLRDGFFEQHCALFQQRPFVWQIWDGRKDGFSALVNYHQLVAPNGEGRRILDKLTHTYLGDWLDRQRADQKAGVEGADGRVAAAEHLKRELEKILEGEPPYDLFVRWKPLHQQPVGWEPDLDDGVRVNIRPFMTAKPLNARGKNACILRVAPKIKWDKDRGKEPTSDKAEFPWFWGWDEETRDFLGGREFDGNRWNDLHYTRAVKLAARERGRGGKS
jgi:hypothetical protein